MTKQSPRSSTPSGTAGRDSESQNTPNPTGLTKAARVIEAARRKNPAQTTAPTSVRESINATLRRLQSAASAAPAKDDFDDRQRELRRREWRDQAMPTSGAPRRHMAMLGRCSREGDAGECWGAAMDAVAERVGSGMLVAVLGSPGSGKTQIGVEAMDRAAWAGQRVLYVNAAALFMQIRDSFRDGGEGEMAVHRRFLGPGLLVIDQLENRKQSYAEDRALFDIINARYNDARDTILISNEKPDDFVAGVGQHIYDRIRHVGEIIECDWPSFRTSEHEQ